MNLLREKISTTLDEFISECDTLSSNLTAVQKEKNQQVTQNGKLNKRLLACQKELDGLKAVVVSLSESLTHTCLLETTHTRTV